MLRRGCFQSRLENLEAENALAVLAIEFAGEAGVAQSQGLPRVKPFVGRQVFEQVASDTRVALTNGSRGKRAG